MLRFRSLASGSSGNAALIQAVPAHGRPTHVLVDSGLGWSQLKTRLAACNLAVQDIDALFITHEHGDHVGCAHQLAAHGVPIWASAGTWRAWLAADPGSQGGSLPRHIARDGQPISIGHLQLHPFTVPHDAQEPLQLRCTDGQRNLGMLTDLGHVTPHVLHSLAHCHALMLESNHDPHMLSVSRYPPFLKRRIAGPHGHLSNQQAAYALAQLKHPALHTVVAMHLSERNNQPSLAQSALAAALNCKPEEIRTAGPIGISPDEWIQV